MSVPLASRAPPVKHVDSFAPLRWLVSGWRDFARAPLAGFVHGLFVALGGWIVVSLSHSHWWLAPGAFTAFVIVGPIIATGLYEISRLLARGERPGLAAAVAAWQRGTRPLVAMGLVLALAGGLWVAISALLFGLFVKVPLQTPLEFLRYAAVGQGDRLFLLWVLFGGLVAAVVFAISAVAPPLMLGRVIGLRDAVLTSVRAVGDNPLPMALWAAIIMVATAFSMVTAMLGFLVVVPVIGHSTWHAYRDLVDPSALALRNE